MSKVFKVYLVRHGEAAASWDTATDPGLSEAGVRQAAAVGAVLAAQPPCAVWASPLARARETARPLAGAWQASVRIEEAVRELPSAGIPMASRRAWLKGVMHSHWEAVDASLNSWRDAAWETLCGAGHDLVVFTHFMVINAIVSRATADPRTVCFEPDYCSVTSLVAADGGLQLEALGKERPTIVNL